MKNPNKSNSDLPLTHADGTINGDNPRVCAAFIDAIGMILHTAMSDIMADPDMRDALSKDVKEDLDTIFRTLQLLRHSIGLFEDWGAINQNELTNKIMSDSVSKKDALERSDQWRVDFLSAAIRDMGYQEDLLPEKFQSKAKSRPDAQLSPAESAEKMLSQMRAEGLIG